MRTFAKLARVGNCWAVIVPRAALLNLGWQPGEPIVHHVINGKLVVASMRTELERIERSCADAGVEAERSVGV